MINYLYQEQNWQSQLSDLITDPLELLEVLKLCPEQLLSGAILASEQFKLRVPKALHKLLSQHAKQEGISMNQYCVYLLTRNDALNAK